MSTPAPTPSPTPAPAPTLSARPLERDGGKESLIAADLSIEDTATALGKKPNAVKQLQHRAMKALRYRLGEEGVTP